MIALLAALVSAALSITAPATATEQAVRLDVDRLPPTPVVVEETQAEPPLTNVLTQCAAAYTRRAAVGLPADFDGLIWRESRCDNSVISRTGCCVGVLQLNSVIFRDHRMLARLAACGATWANVRGSDYASLDRNICAAKALYDTVGRSPWAL